MAMGVMATESAARGNLGVATRIRRSSIWWGGALLLPGMQAYAQERAQLQAQPQATQVRTWSIVPTISSQLTHTDNVDLASSSEARSDTYVEIAPGVAVHHVGGHLRLELDYRLRLFRYLHETERNGHENRLSTSGQLEAIERLLYVDARAEVQQRPTSAFGPQFSSTGGSSTNRREERTYSLTPYVIGQLGSVANYRVGYGMTWTRSSDQSGFLNGTENSGNRYRVADFNGTLTGATKVAGFAWSADASSTLVQYADQVRDVEWSQLRGLLAYEMNPQFRLRGAVGVERNTVESDEPTTSSLHAYGFEWVPSERTTMSAIRERRFFGSGHTIQATHRTAQTSWSLSDIKNVGTDAASQLGDSLGTALDLVSAILAGRIADPVQRSIEARRLLTQARISPDFGGVTSFSTASVFVERRRQLSMTWLHPRDTVVLSAYRTDRRAIGSTASGAGDFAISEQISQRGASGSWSHRLTPLSTLNLVGELVRSESAGGTRRKSEDWSVTLLMSTRLGIQTSGVAGIRHRRFDTGTASDGTNAGNGNENSIFVSVAHQF